MISNPNNVDLYFKVDGGNCLKVLIARVRVSNFGDLVPGQWQTFACSIQNLQLQGLNVRP